MTTNMRLAMRIRREMTRTTRTKTMMSDASMIMDSVRPAGYRQFEMLER